ncbi:uncharacterized protein [Spinacia oleracea]|uniref:SWIM-type domain-containing protein n=1 Tax=Spinacia oleracea TaxID=3562 RepID=A0ABM3R3Q3_SPIOL|nr:uncharacterized protein LOC130465489 [Spinacia oleracea]
MKKNRQLKTTWVAKQFLEVFKARPHWPAKEIMETIRRAFKIVVKKEFAYKVKYAAHDLLHGSMHEHYKKVGGYVATLKSSSPGTVVELVTDVSKQAFLPVFQRFYTCFEGLQKGWKQGCRKVIVVDACFLKTFLGGQLMSAIGKDGNDQMYPICWAVVEGENNLSWQWFFLLLQSSLDLGEGEGIAIISDEHQAILNVVAAVLPKAEHRHCARHIFAHWHKAYRGDEMKLLFWKIAKAYNLADYNDAMDELTQLNVDAATAFKGYKPELFCRAFLDTSMKTDAITSNIAETFNGYIIQARTKHLIFMLEDIRNNLMQRLVLKRQQMEKSTSVLCPRIQQKLEKEKTKAANCDVIPSTDTLFNVNYYLDQLVVDLEARTCSCRKWDMFGIPCCHAIACIFFQNKEAKEFVDQCYRREAYLTAYAGSIPPIDGERYWPRIEYHLDPPPIKIGPGRPRRNRVKDPFEISKKPGHLSRTGMEMTCSVCKVKGHNKRRCPNRNTTVVAEPAPKRPRGRPRHDGQPPHSRAPSVTAPSSTVAQATTPTPNTTTCSAASSRNTRASNTHQSSSCQPTQLGRGGRMILGGRGSRGGSIGRGRGNTGGRGKNKVPIGVGMYVASDGTAMTSGGRGRGRGRGKQKATTPIGTQSSQVSSCHQPTQ